MLLLKLGMKGPGYFNRNTFILQLILSFFFLSGWLGKKRKRSTMFAKSKGRVSLGRGVVQWDCQYTSVFESTNFSQQNCTCVLAEMLLVAIAVDDVEFVNFIYSGVKCL